MIRKILLIILAALMTGLPLVYFVFPTKTYHLLLKGITPSSPIIKPSEIDPLNRPVFLDARPLEEFKVSHIKDAQRVGFEDFSSEKVEHLPKDTTIVIYCSVGYRSGKIMQKMHALGFKNTLNLFGGIFEWKSQGNAVYDSTGQTEKVHTYNRFWGIWLREGEKVY